MFTKTAKYRMLVKFKTIIKANGFLSYEKCVSILIHVPIQTHTHTHNIYGLCHSSKPKIHFLYWRKLHQQQAKSKRHIANRETYRERESERMKFIGGINRIGIGPTMAIIWLWIWAERLKRQMVNIFIMVSIFRFHTMNSFLQCIQTAHKMTLFIMKACIVYHTLVCRWCVCAMISRQKMNKSLFRVCFSARKKKK